MTPSSEIGICPYFPRKTPRKKKLAENGHPFKRRSERESDRFRRVEENNINEFKVHYDEAEDILHLGREGQENEVVELSPGVNIELDDKGKLIGIELFKASPAPEFYPRILLE